MSNVYTHSDFAVLSIMNSFDDNVYIGSSCFIQRKPETKFLSPTCVSFDAADGADRANFDVQARFEANVVPAIVTRLSNLDNSSFENSNSNISVISYSLDATTNS